MLVHSANRFFLPKRRFPHSFRRKSESTVDISAKSVYNTFVDTVRQKKKGRQIMKNFFPEFKKFITRGNVVDMSVGVIVGGAFTAIVNGLGNNILKPLVNWILALIFGAESLSEVFTFLKKVEVDVLDEAGAVIGKEIDLAQSIYIDWGAFINAVINFFITAFVLFTIVKIINKLRENNENIAKKKLSREQKKELRAQGIKLYEREKIKEYFAEKQRLADEAAATEAAAAAEQARLDREANPTTEDLLKLILAEIKKN